MHKKYNQMNHQSRRQRNRKNNTPPDHVPVEKLLPDHVPVETTNVLAPDYVPIEEHPPNRIPVEHQSSPRKLSPDYIPVRSSPDCIPVENATATIVVTPEKAALITPEQKPGSKINTAKAIKMIPGVQRKSGRYPPYHLTYVIILLPPPM